MSFQFGANNQPGSIGAGQNSNGFSTTGGNFPTSSTNTNFGGSAVSFGAPSSNSGLSGGNAAFPSFGNPHQAPPNNSSAVGFSNFGMNGGTSNTYTNPQQQGNALEFSGDTLYSQLPEPYKKEIDRTFAEFKTPMRQGTEQILQHHKDTTDFQGCSTTTPTILDVKIELQQLHVRVMHIENVQRQLQSVIKPYLQQLRTTAQTAHLQGTLGLKQIHNHSPHAALLLPGCISSASSSFGRVEQTGGRQLPSKWFLLVAEQLEHRLHCCCEEISSLESRMSAQLQALSIFTDDAAGATAGQGVATRTSRSSRIGAYGQLQRVGPPQVLALLKDQLHGFLQLSQAVAAVHADTDSLRDSFRQLLKTSARNPSAGSGFAGTLMDPFAAADRQETSAQRRLDQKISSEAEKYHQLQQQTKLYQSSQQQQQQQTHSATPSSNSTFGGSTFGSAFATPSLQPASSTPAAAAAPFSFGAALAPTEVAATNAFAPAQNAVSFAMPPPALSSSSGSKKGKSKK